MTSEQSVAGQDESSLRRPTAVGSGHQGVKQLLKCLQAGTSEVRNLLLHECDVIYECRACHALYRSLPDFLLHKRNYCGCTILGFLYPGDDSGGVTSTVHSYSDAGSNDDKLLQAGITEPQHIPTNHNAVYQTVERHVVSYPEGTVMVEPEDPTGYIRMNLRKRVAVQPRRPWQSACKSFMCRTCGRAFASRRSLLFHVESLHSGPRSKPSAKPANISQNPLTMKSTGTAKSPTKFVLHRCVKCNKAFGRKDLLDQHACQEPVETKTMGHEGIDNLTKKTSAVQNNITKESRLRCLLCSCSYTTEWNLNRHIDLKHKSEAKGNSVHKSKHVPPTTTTTTNASQNNKHRVNRVYNISTRKNARYFNMDPYAPLSLDGPATLRTRSGIYRKPNLMPEKTYDTEDECLTSESPDYDTSAGKRSAESADLEDPCTKRAKLDDDDETELKDGDLSTDETQQSESKNSSWLSAEVTVEEGSINCVGDAQQSGSKDSSLLSAESNTDAEVVHIIPDDGDCKNDTEQDNNDTESCNIINLVEDVSTSVCSLSVESLRDVSRVQHYQTVTDAVDDDDKLPMYSIYLENHEETEGPQLKPAQLFNESTQQTEIVLLVGSSNDDCLSSHMTEGKLAESLRLPKSCDIITVSSAAELNNPTSSGLEMCKNNLFAAKSRRKASPNQILHNVLM